MEVKLKTSKSSYLIDEPIHIIAQGCQPNTEITLSAEMQDDEGKLFQSEASFISDESGVVDLAKAPSIKGNYKGIHSSGLIWSMRLKESMEEDYFEKSSDEPVKVTIYLLVDKESVSQTEISLVFKDKSVKKEIITHEKIKGALYSPVKEGVYPAVVLFNGSDGGYKANAAAFLASKGFVVLALGYFNTEGVSKELEHIPLEYFKTATDWLRTLAKSNGEVHLIGYSRGAELALLLGATYDEYASITAGAPCAYVTSGMKDGVFAPVTGWTLNGEAVPYLRNKYPLKMMWTYLTSAIYKKPMSFLSIWEKTLTASKNKESHQIDSTAISCPLLLISGEDDQLWPSADFSRVIEHTRDNKKDQFIYYDKGGHFLAFPYGYKNLPANTHMKIGKMTMRFGGEKKGNAKAAGETFEVILNHLKDS